MHTIMILSIGFAVLIACLLLGRYALGGLAKGALLFIPVWFVGASINVWIGITQAGYTFMQELPVFLITFLIPAGVALLIRYKYK